MALPVKKIYVDSQYRTADSLDTSSFKIELPHSISMPRDSIFMIDDVCIPHAWQTIETDFNDKLYFLLTNTYFGVPATWSKIVQLPNGNYTGDLLGANLQIALNEMVLGTTIDQFQVSYNPLEFTIGIANTNPRISWYMLTDTDLKTRFNGLFTESYDITNPSSLNEVLRNYSNNTKYTSTSPYESSFLNLQLINNIYLSSPNLGNFTTIGPRGEESIIRKIPVSSEFGYMIIDRNTSNHDYLECSKASLKTIEFNLRDSRGRYVPLHGANISFSIIFSVQKEDM